MLDVAKQLSLREIIGNLVPGMLVILAMTRIYSAIDSISLLDDIGISSRYGNRYSSGVDIKFTSSDVLNVVLAIILSYGVGMLITSISGKILEKLDAPEGRIMRFVSWVFNIVKLRNLIDSDSADPASDSIVELRRNWMASPIMERYISRDTMERIRDIYRSFFDTEPKGEDALHVCELFVRERTPGASIQIERHAALATLFSNLMLPAVLWLIALLLSTIQYVRPIFDGAFDGRVLQIVIQIALIVLYVFIIRFIAGVLREQWSQSWRYAIRDTLLGFLVASTNAMLAMPANDGASSGIEGSRSRPGTA